MRPPLRRFSRRVLLAVLTLAVASSLSSRPARAQSITPESDPLNHAFAVYLGTGIYVSNGNQVYVFRVAPKVKIRDWETNRVGVRIRINGTVGFYNFNLKDLIDLEFPERVATLALVPGVEIPVKVFDSWTLFPFLDLGVGWDDLAKDSTFVFGVGSRSRAEFHDKRHTYVLWNELIYAANKEDDVFPTDDFSVFRTELDLRGLVWFRALKRKFDLGVLFRNELYFNRLVVQKPNGEKFAVNQRWELGVTFGASEPWKHFKRMVKAPRLGVSYRFGDGATGVRFILRFRY